MLGQISKSTNSNAGRVVEKIHYDDRAMPVQKWSLGTLQQTLTYQNDGNLATSTDGNGNTTTWSSWKCGIAQSIA